MSNHRDPFNRKAIAKAKATIARCNEEMRETDDINTRAEIMHRRADAISALVAMRAMH